MTKSKHNKQQPQPKPQTNENHRPSNNGRRYVEDSRPQTIESVQPPRPKPGGNKDK